MVQNLRRGDVVVTEWIDPVKVTKVKENNELDLELAEGVKVRVGVNTIADVVSKTEPTQRLIDELRTANMLFIDLWKKVVIWVVVALGLVLALPNAFYDRVEQFNDAEKAIEVGFDTPENREKTGLWLSFLPSGLVNLGLDLRGGAHLLAEVQVADVYAQRMTALWPDVRDVLRPERATVGTIRLQKGAPDELRVKISEPAGMDRALQLVRGLSQPVTSLGGAMSTDLDVRAEGDDILVTLSAAEQAATTERTLRRLADTSAAALMRWAHTDPPSAPGRGSYPDPSARDRIGGRVEEIIGTTARDVSNLSLDAVAIPMSPQVPGMRCCRR